MTQAKADVQHEDVLALWVAAIETDPVIYGLPAYGPWTSVDQAARLFATWARDEAAGRPAPALCRRCGLLLRAVHLDDPHQQLHPWCTPPLPADLQNRAADHRAVLEPADVRAALRNPGTGPEMTRNEP